MHFFENGQSSELRKMKRLATSLLGVFSLIYVVSLLIDQQSVWTGFIQATAEAAMVGAIADWFAVTALFRHPLGLPIPHTAIVPARKDQIGQTLGRFVKENFLQPEVIISKLRSIEAAKQLASWISQPANSDLLANYVAVGLGAAIQVMKDEDIQELIQQSITHQIQVTNISPLLGNGLLLLASGGRQRELANGTITLVGQLVTDNKGAIKARIAQETPWWLPKNLDDVIFEKIIDSTDRMLRDIRRDPKHPFHAKFNEVIESFIEELRSSPDVLAKEAAIKADLLNDPLVQDFSSSLWTDLKTALLTTIANPDADARQPIQRGIIRFAEALLQDQSMLAKVDQWIEAGAVYLAREYGHEVEQLIAHTISRWDPQETSQKIELQVGKDLQFIRINGTLVGGLVGFIIHAISLLF
jgi:uncharacterized membrane-anchored protein YjiN (DUF445 family)